MAKSSSSTTAWKPTWTWAPTSACSIRISSAANFTTNGQILSSRPEEGTRRRLPRPRCADDSARHRRSETASLRELAAKTKADVVFVEVGGTVGDYENALTSKPAVSLPIEEGEDSVVFVALTYVLEPNALGEQKSKAAQLGIKRLMEVGIMPHIIACRAPVRSRKRSARRSRCTPTCPMQRVFSMHDVESIYLIPEMLREAGMDREVLTLLDLHDRVNQRRKIRPAQVAMVRRPHRQGARREVTIAVTGKYTASAMPTPASSRPANIAAMHLGVNVNFKWIDTTDDRRRPTSPSRRTATASSSPAASASAAPKGKIECIRYARENKIPYLGLCLGFQMAVIEYARNVCGIHDANTTEFDPNCKNSRHRHPPRTEKNRRPRRQHAPRRQGHRAQARHHWLSGSSTTPGDIRLRFRHRYEVDPKYIPTLEEHGLIFRGKHPTQPIMQILELPTDVHPYFVGTQRTRN